MNTTFEQRFNRLHELQQQIADEAARKDVKHWYLPVQVNDTTWLGENPRYPGQVTRALEYLALRGLIEYDGKLVRFVEEGK